MHTTSLTLLTSPIRCGRSRWTVLVFASAPLAAAMIVCAASPVRVIRTVETRDPADSAMVLVHGETIDLCVRMLNYAMPMDLTGYTVVLHGQTNGQSVSESYQIVGLAGLPDDPSAAALGWTSVALPVSTWWPASAPSGRWTLVATAPGTAARVMRAGGPLTVRGSAAADALAPLPQSVAAGLRAQWLADIALATNALPQGSSGTATGALHAVTADRLVGTNAWSAIDSGTQVFYRVVGATTNRTPVALASDLDAATNHLVATYLLGTNAWMTVSNQTLTIWRTIDGVSSSLWSSAESEVAGDEIDLSFTNALMSALSAKADKAWGQYAPDGSPNPDPAYMTFLNAPATMHASGFQWATYGAYSVMAESGAVAYESGADGTARWGLDLQTNYVGFIRGGSMIVAAKAGAINVTGGGTTNGIAEIDYPYTSGDFPALWFAPALDVPFSVQTGVVWIDNEDGTATVNAPATTPKGFWYATTTVSYDVIFDIRPPARLTGGVFGTTNAAPVVYDSVIEIESDGKTYRMPAQEVP